MKVGMLHIIEGFFSGIGYLLFLKGSKNKKMSKKEYLGIEYIYKVLIPSNMEKCEIGAGRVSKTHKSITPAKPFSLFSRFQNAVTKAKSSHNFIYNSFSCADSGLL